MKTCPYKITDSTQGLLLALSRSTERLGARLRYLGRQHEKELVDQIKTADELESVIGLAPFLSGPGYLAKLVVNAIVAILGQRDPLQLVRLDEQFRQYSEYGVTAWNSRSRSISPVQNFQEPLVLGLLSLYPSGYVREEAVKKLSQTNHYQALTFLLLRSNDWVKKIRQSAVDEIVHRATPPNIDQFIVNLALIDRCSLKTRSDFSIVRSAIDDLLVEFPSRLEQCLDTDNFRLRRAIYNLSNRLHYSVRQRFIRLGLKDSDALSRLHAARSVEGITDPTDQERLITLLIKDTFYAIRLVALQLALSASPERKAAILKRLLVDRSRSVRNSARFHLRNEELVPHEDYFSQRYRDAISNGDLIAGISGLGECGNKNDIKIIGQFLKHEYPSVASIALESICTLSNDEQTKLLLEFLNHEHPRCSRTAAHWLCKNTTPLIHEICIANIDDTTLASHVRKNSLNVALSQGKWLSLEAILTALIREDGNVSEPARSALTAWTNRINSSFTELSELQRGKIRQVLTAAKISQNQRRLLFSLLD